MLLPHPSGVSWCPQLPVSSLPHPSEDTPRGFSSVTHRWCWYSMDTHQPLHYGAGTATAASLQCQRDGRAAPSSQPSPQQPPDPRPGSGTMMDGVKWSLGKTNTWCWIAANSPPQAPNGPPSRIPLGGLAALSPAPLKNKSSSQCPTAPRTLVPPISARPQTTGGAEDVSASSLQLLSQRLMWVFQSRGGTGTGGDSCGQASRGAGVGDAGAGPSEHRQ